MSRAKARVAGSTNGRPGDGVERPVGGDERLRAMLQGHGREHRVIGRRADHVRLAPAGAAGDVARAPARLRGRGGAWSCPWPGFSCHMWRISTVSQGRPPSGWALAGSCHPSWHGGSALSLQDPPISAEWLLCHAIGKSRIRESRERHASRAPEGHSPMTARQPAVHPGPKRCQRCERCGRVPTADRMRLRARRSVAGGFPSRAPEGPDPSMAQRPAPGGTPGARCSSQAGWEDVP